MTEYFYVTRSNAAPFFSDTRYGFIEAENPTFALYELMTQYDHPSGMYSAGIWASADAYHKNEPALMTWLSERATKQTC